MKFTRRNFVKLGGFAVLAGITLPNSAFGQISENNILANLTTESFRDLVGSEFYVLSENLSTPSILVKVQDFPAATETGECFALTFAVKAKRIKQATYRVFHPELGNFELFMTEGKSGRSNALIALINRI